MAMLVITRWYITHCTLGKLIGLNSGSVVGFSLCSGSLNAKEEILGFWCAASILSPNIRRILDVTICFLIFEYHPLICHDDIICFLIYKWDLTDISISGWWFGTCFIFPFSWEFHHPNWLSLHHFSEGLAATTNQIYFHAFSNLFFWIDTTRFGQSRQESWPRSQFGTPGAVSVHAPVTPVRRWTTGVFCDAKWRYEPTIMGIW